MPQLFKYINKISLILASFFIGASAVAEELPRFNMRYGVTPVSHDIYDLHMTVFWIMVLIGLIVFGIMFYASFKYRKAKGAVAAKFHENTKLEIVLLIIPFIILVAMAVPATKVLMRLDNADDSSVTIKVTGYQWRWEYEYLDNGIKFFSDLSTPQEQIENLAPKGKWYLLEVNHELVVPTNEKIRFLITSNDVIHSWWVPALGVKKDAVPGFMHEAWAKIEKPGTYRGQCAELCGANHGFMPIVVKAVTPANYKKWVAKELKEQNKGAK